MELSKQIISFVVNHPGIVTFVNVQLIYLIIFKLRINLINSNYCYYDIMASQESIANSIKIWAFPVLATALSTMIWTDVREIQNDVKHLMAESNISGTKIQSVEQRVDKLEQVVFIERLTKSTSDKKSKPEPPKFYAVLQKEDNDNKKENVNF